MLTAEQIREALRGIDDLVAAWVLAHIANGHPLEAQRLLLSQLPPGEWNAGRELVASLTREHVRSRTWH